MTEALEFVEARSGSSVTKRDIEEFESKTKYGRRRGCGGGVRSDMRQLQSIRGDDDRASDVAGHEREVRGKGEVRDVQLGEASDFGWVPAMVLFVLQSLWHA
jgi:hypothetical protein